MKLQGIASIVAQVGPTFAVQSGPISTVARIGVGTYDVGLTADQGAAALERVIFMLSRSAGGAAAQNAFGVVDTSDVLKRFTTLLEQGAGGSILADVNFDLAVCSLNLQDDQNSIIAAGSVDFTAGVPSYTFAGGGLSATIGDNAPGDIAINFLADRGADAGQCVILATPRQVAGALAGLRTIDVVHSSDTQKRVVLRQGDPVSALTDFAFDFVVVNDTPPVSVAGNPLLRLHSYLQVTGATGAIVANGGAVASVVRTGAGVYQVNLQAGNGLAAGDGAFVCCPNGAAGASAMRTCEIEHNSATQKTVRWRQEGAAGGASAAADVNFNLFSVAETGS